MSQLTFIVLFFSKLLVLYCRCLRKFGPNYFVISRNDILYICCFQVAREESEQDFGVVSFPLSYKGKDKDKETDTDTDNNSNKDKD